MDKKHVRKSEKGKVQLPRIAELKFSERCLKADEELAEPYPLSYLKADGSVVHSKVKKVKPKPPLKALGDKGRLVAKMDGKQQCFVAKDTQKRLSKMSLPELERIYDPLKSARGPSMWDRKQYYTTLELGAYIIAKEKEAFFSSSKGSQEGVMVVGPNREIIPNKTYGHYYPSSTAKSYKKQAEEYFRASQTAVEKRERQRRLDSRGGPLTLDALIEDLSVSPRR